MKRKLVKCAQRAYSELIRLDIPGSSGARPARLSFLRSSLLSVMKHPIPKCSSPYVSETLTAKPTQGELRSRLEVLAKKKRSLKRKPPSSLEGCPLARGKTLKVGASPSPSSAVGAGDSERGGGGGGEPSSSAFRRFLVYAVFASSDIQLGLRRCELGSKVGVFWMWLPMPGSTFPSLGTSLLLPSELDCNSRLVAAVTPRFPVRPKMRIRTEFGARDYILRLFTCFFLIFF